MKTIADLVELLKAGQQPVVVFQKDVHDKEHYAEPGMRARALSATTPDSDDVLKIVFEFSEFDDFNRPLESSNYYDKSGNPTLTAREAGYFKPTDSIYYGLTDPLSDQLEIVDSTSVALFNEFKALNLTESYVVWLEKQLLAARQK